MAFDIGPHVGRYVISRPLGRGAAGLVFVAFDPQLDREVALELLRPRGKDADGSAQQRLLEEAQALAILRGNRGDAHATADAFEALADALEATGGPPEDVEALRAEAQATRHRGEK